MPSIKAYSGLTAFLLVSTSLYAAPNNSLGLGRVGKIEVSLSQIKLEGRRDTQQIVVTGIVNGEPRDITDKVQFDVPEQGAVRVRGGRVEAVRDGKGDIVIRIGNRTLHLPYTVSHYTKPAPIRFTTETLAILTKQGCSTGSCHGSPHGKGGFSLSLFGYDARIDRISLTRDGFNRRINGIEPLESLLIKKPLLAVPHVGGKRLRKTDIGYAVLRDWIAEGASTELSTVSCDRITLTPSAGRVLEGDFKTQQIGVTAQFSDGRVRDVTPIATYTSSHPAVADVTPDGKIIAKGRGQASISVRYLDKLESIFITVVEPIAGFVWKPVQEYNSVDRLVNAKLRQLKYLPSETCSDSEFLRRLYLDLTGLLPEVDTTRQFLKDASLDKRAKKIKTLLASEEYARFWALKKADLMRVSPRQLSEERAGRFSTWLVGSLRQDTPYDQFARTLLTAQGLEAKNPSANYFLGIRSQEERTEMTAQIFMGTRVECAKCHNHPFENWTMRDYYRIAAVFARTKADSGRVQLASVGEVLHPTTGEKMLPWGRLPNSSELQDRREVFARWLTDPANPFFARVEVNRIWADLMGRGVVEPIDDFRSSNPPSNVPLLDYLAGEFVKSGYSRKHILSLICNSQTYQRSTRTNAFNKDDTMLFSHAKPRLLTAEQLKDAIGGATRGLPPASSLPQRIEEVHTALTAHYNALAPKFESWLTEAEATLKQASIRQNAWRVRIAAAITDPNRILREAGITGIPTLSSGEGWIRRPDYLEQIQNSLPIADTVVNEDYSLTTLARQIFSDKPRTVRISWSAEMARLWLNGKPLTPAPVQGERQIVLPLVSGENTLLIQVATTANRAQFTYRVVDPSSDITVGEHKERRLTAAVNEVLAVPIASRTPEQVQELRDFYQTDSESLTLLQRIASMNMRMDYATQRPYPELSGFTTTFGQPQRDTACTCERQNSPTLLQALELLNGQTAYARAAEGARFYSKQSDPALIEELYLAALSRFPSEKERATASKYLSERANNREQAVMDFLWAVINTQEFLFQH